MRATTMFLILSLALVGCGAPPAATRGALDPGATAQEPVSDVLKVVCDHERTRVETPRVRPFDDGVHAHFENVAGADEYWVRAVSSPDDGNHGGSIEGGLQRWGWSDPPGEYYIACFRKGDDPPFYEMDDRYARYEVVDVDGLWISSRPDCDEPETLDQRPIEGATSMADVEAWIRDHYDVDVGELVRPGYPETGWHSDPWVIRSDGRTLVYFDAMEQQGRWVLFEAAGCRGPHQLPTISPSTEEVPSGESLPNTIQIVCDENRTRVLTPRVMPNSDGLFAHFENPGDADEFWVREVDSADLSAHGGRVPDEAERAWPWSDPPGRHLVVCYRRGDEPPFDDFGARAAEFEIVDPEHLWVSWEAECDDAVTYEDEPVEGATSDRDIERWVRDRFDLHDAQLGQPGYPWTGWKGEPWVLTRGDVTVAGWHAYAPDGEWTVSGSACPG